MWLRSSWYRLSQITSFKCYISWFQLRGYWKCNKKSCWNQHKSVKLLFCIWLLVRLYLWRDKTSIWYNCNVWNLIQLGVLSITFRINQACIEAWGLIVYTYWLKVVLFWTWRRYLRAWAIFSGQLRIVVAKSRNSLKNKQFKVNRACNNCTPPLK